jgi:hypothetical protein
MPTQSVGNRSANGSRRRLVPKSKIQLQRALTQSKEIIRVAVPNANRQKYYNLVNSIKKFSKAPNNTPKQILNQKAKNIFNAYSKLPGQSGLGYTQKLEILRHFRELIAIYSRVHANSLQEGALLSGTSGIPIVGRVLRSVARTMVR